MSIYHNDKPVDGTSENPDKLNRIQFAKNIAEILCIKPSAECMTVSLEGEWGFGKTSIINLIKSELNKYKNNPIIIEYNPWLTGHAETLTQDFLVQFSSQLHIPDRPKDGLKVSQQLLAYSKLFNVMKFIPGVEPWASTIQDVIKSVGTATSKISKLKEFDLVARKKMIAQAINSLNISIVVIIDDIDRLTPDESFQMVRLIKSVADFPSTSFLLAFDPIYLTTSLEKNGICKSSQYIDKIIQLRIPIPVIAYRNLHEIVSYELEKISYRTLLNVFYQDRERFSYVYNKHIKHLIRSPRELKRIINHLHFSMLQTYENVCFTDLFCLSVIAIKNNELYSSIKENPEYYIGKGFNDEVSYDSYKDSEIVELHIEDRREILSKIQRRDSRHITGMLEEVFPLLSNSSCAVFDYNYDASGRIAAPERLYIALHYQTPAGTTSNNEVQKFIEGKIDRDSYIKKSIEHDFLERTLEIMQYMLTLNNLSDKNYSESLMSLYINIFDSEYVNELNNSGSMLSFDPYTAIKKATFEYIDKTQEKEKFIFSLLDDKKLIPIATEIAREIGIQDKEAAQGKIAKNNWLRKSSATRYLNKWSEIVYSELVRGDILESTHINIVYYVFKAISKEKLIEILDSWMNKNPDLRKIAKLIGRTGRSSGGGAFSEINLDTLSDIIDIQKLKAMVDIELETNQEELSNFFKAVYLSMKTGKRYFLNNGLIDNDI